jgi:hemerythrin
MPHGSAAQSLRGAQLVATPMDKKPRRPDPNASRPARSGDRAARSNSTAGSGRVAGKRPTLRWVEPFSLDVQLLDDQHRRLLEHVQQAIAALQGARERDAAQLLDSITDIAREHFNDEEMLMHEVEYPGYVNHVEQHRRLVLQVENLQARLALRIVAPRQAIYDLRSWFALHLIRYDADLPAYVHRRRRPSFDSIAQESAAPSRFGPKAKHR